MEKNFAQLEANRMLRQKRIQQKELVSIFNRMVTSTTDEIELGIEKQKLQDLFHELLGMNEGRSTPPFHRCPGAYPFTSEELTSAVFWKYTRGNKYKADDDETFKYYRTVHKSGVRVRRAAAPVCL